MNKVYMLLLLASLVALALLGLACGGEDTIEGPSTEMVVSLNEWSVAPAVTEVPAGRVTFAIKNDGRTKHELQVAPADKPHDEIAIRRGIEPGETERMTVNLKAGEYELACHLVEGQTDHYQLGMRTTLRVVGP